MKYSITPEKEIRAIKGLLLELSGQKVVEQQKPEGITLLFPNRQGIGVVRVLGSGENRDAKRLKSYRELLAIAARVHQETQGGLPAFFATLNEEVYEAQ